jgi:hypothetical protein
MEVHEHPVINGTVGSIRARIDHRDVRGVEHWVAKHNEYSSWEAARFRRYAGDLAVRAQWTMKQRVKYALMKTPFLGIAYFFGSFFLMGGWRDGAAGFAFARMKMRYFMEISRKIRESRSGLWKDAAAVE